MAKKEKIPIDNVSLTDGNIVRCAKCGKPIIVFTKSKHVLCGECSEKQRRK